MKARSMNTKQPSRDYCPLRQSGQSGRVSDVVDFVRDITKAEDVEAALWASEQKYRELAELLPQPVFETDATGRFTYGNSKGFDAFGYTEEDLRHGKNLLDLIVPGDHAAARDRIAAMIRDRTPSPPYDYTALRKDGSTFPATIYSTPIFRDTIFLGLRGLLIDQTAREQAEREKIELLDKLRHAEKMQAIGELAGSVAHDFNNQLGGIMNCAEMLSQQLREEGRTDLLEQIRIITRSTERATALTAQLFAFARRGNYLPVPVNVHAVIAEVIALLGQSIDSRISIRTDFNAQVICIPADPTLLQNAILNITLNGRDAMPEGGELLFSTHIVTLTAEHCAKTLLEIVPGNYCAIEIRDTGQGMSKETMKHIFEPFYTTKKAQGGSGMGLASVYGTMKTMRGSIAVKSRPGSGTAFTLYLPVDTPVPTTIPAAPRKTGSVAGHGRILLVDDEDSVRLSVAAMLKRLGYDVVECASGIEALVKLRADQSSFHAILLDMSMPGMDGRETFTELRRINPAVRVVLTSGHIVNTEIQRTMAAGAINFIKKPFKIAELSLVIAEALEA
jgi:PAS domain S-box-containing protein